MSILKNQIPKDKAAYFIKNGEGEHYIWNQQVFTFLATNESTKNMFEVVTITGVMNNSFPSHFHKEMYESLIVIEGVLEIHLQNELLVLNRGDYIFIPPGVVHSYTMKAHRTKILSYHVEGAITDVYKSIAKPYKHSQSPSYISEYETINKKDIESNFDINFSSKNATKEKIGFFKSGEGENFLTGDQLHSLVTKQNETDGKYIVVSSEGPRGEAIVSHYHEKHTETFYCFEGKVTMWVGKEKEKISLYPGDFLHAPAHTIHSYRFDNHYTKMIGLLVPGLFEPFFKTLGEHYKYNTFPNEPQPLRFENVLKELGNLDLKLFE